METKKLMDPGIEKILAESGVDVKKIEKLSDMVVKHGKCVLCGNKPDFGALWIPKDMIMNAMTGVQNLDPKICKLRVAVYGLCTKCLKIENIGEKIDAAMLQKCSNPEKAAHADEILKSEDKEGEGKDKPLLN